ncbi:bifunctional phosphoribosylaminoimidazolecarboxamide formyltransferase/IMP cyclohydrolase [Anoxybacter fermentans]|uniref:Bifunctional purine biosynthesis protein PurH n=1 Tax=Anoxybacter fermentans TaxID=1323375 RepID=A0A3Q9HS04_9FIRM|nr:bifunctional phosphoribosylaminoimidazolecarboxamide formyltransferase/IMP cyclohydrolase [Anoxybacter fermentans]AZR74229.1 bifunctional phosphoribosylaminoimidazolecarboxamide formyltransferase/IMP cyclohydrolase [Anoxybacter fermentans]
MKRALISVSNKEGIVEFAKGLKELGIEIISTGGTAKILEEAGLKIIQISEITRFPEMMDGRVKTLHPNVHGGILARRSNPNDLKELAELGIETIDLVVVNLYPFAETIAKDDVDLDEALENIDIGGPTLIRAAAKNFKDVAVVVDQADYPIILEELRSSGGELSFKTRLKLAGKAFNHTANYDAMIDNYFMGLLKKETEEMFPERMQIRLEKVMDLRYGENPHQKAAFYREIGAPAFNSVSTAKQLHGKELSFNNLNDANGALELVREFIEPAAVIIKHANPCGAAVAENLAEAYKKAYEGDPVSAYGSIVAVNRPIDLTTAKAMTGKDKFIEVILAPSYEPEALTVLKERWKNVRILEVGKLLTYPELPASLPIFDLKRIQGGLLVQELDREDLIEEELKVVTSVQPEKKELSDLRLAWKIVKHVKSNAIVLVKDGALVGVGAGQMSRVDAMEIAINKAGERAKGAVAASDAFFPFRDGIDLAAKAGVRAIIQPGGSIRDEEVIAACNEHGIAMLFTGMRHFKH